MIFKDFVHISGLQNGVNIGFLLGAENTCMSVKKISHRKGRKGVRKGRKIGWIVGYSLRSLRKSLRPLRLKKI